MIEVDFENWKKGRVPHEINNFSALIFMLIAKADFANLCKLRREWPEHVEMWRQWMLAPSSDSSKPGVQLEEEGLAERRGWDG